MLGKKTMIKHCVDAVRANGLHPVVAVKTNLGDCEDVVSVGDTDGQADTIRICLDKILNESECSDQPIFIVNSDVIITDTYSNLLKMVLEVFDLGFQCMLSVQEIEDPSGFSPSMSYCYPGNRPYLFQEKPKRWIPGSRALTGVYAFDNAARFAKNLRSWRDEDEEMYLSSILSAYAHVTATMPLSVVDWGTPELLDADPNVLGWG